LTIAEKDILAQKSAKVRQYINIGCGNRFHVDWVNVDLAPACPHIIKCDIRGGLPFSSSEFDAIYHSHLLEHLEKHRAIFFLRECFRVLKSKGLIRVVVPDLERIARGYLHWLEAAVNGVAQAEANYDWVVLELLDQMVRTRSGGDMAAYLQTGKPKNLEFVKERCGKEIADIASENRSQAQKRRSWLEYVRIPRLRRLREFGSLMVLGQQRYELLAEAKFGASGELHRWMYDKFSLSRMLKGAGFEDIQVVTATLSRIPRWTSYELDTGTDGQPFKPDSLYIEAMKP
jgi:SAM-dependent methyltransferase